MTWLNLASEVLELEAEALLSAAKNLNNSIDRIVELIVESGPSSRVVVIGMGKSGHIGRKLAATLSSTGTPAFFMHPGEAGHGDLGLVTKDDVVIALSQSGKSEEILKILPYFKRKAIKLVAFTGNTKSPLALHSDYVINTWVEKEACPLGLAPTSSTTLALALGDSLAVCLLKAKGFTEGNFAETHPLGSLGKKLLVIVKDVMTSIEESPKVSIELNVHEALLEISKGGMGFAVIVDDHLKPLGVFTDGDLRRCLNSGVDLKDASIGKVMTKDFSVVTANKLAVEAVELMEAKKVSGLPVVCEGGKLCGTINMRQILQAGVV